MRPGDRDRCFLRLLEVIQIRFRKDGLLNIFVCWNGDEEPLSPDWVRNLVFAVRASDGLLGHYTISQFCRVGDQAVMVFVVRPVETPDSKLLARAEQVMRRESVVLITAGQVRFAYSLAS